MDAANLNIWCVFYEWKRGWKEITNHFYYDDYDKAKHKFDELRNEDIESDEPLLFGTFNPEQLAYGTYAIYQDQPNSYAAYEARNHERGFTCITLRKVVLEE
jgi:hypothetical protein